MEKLIIPRDIWLHNEGSERSYLFRPDDGKMCCLGIYLHQCKNVDKEKLKDIHCPSRFESEKFNIEWLVDIKTAYEENLDRKQIASADAYCLMELNDLQSVIDMDTDEVIDLRSRDERESRIAEVFLKNNVEVTFVDSLG